LGFPTAPGVLRKLPRGRMQGAQDEDPDDPLTTLLEHGMGIRTDSMDLQNDPRFFQGNVIDKRFAAFGALSVISSIMVGLALEEAYSMRKDIVLPSVMGIAQLVGFVLMEMVLCLNLAATYTAVAQTYHTYRLMTAGPTGFEAAASYYLNRHIAFWRHLAVKSMLFGFPVLMVATGIRLAIKTEKDYFDAHFEFEKISIESNSKAYEHVEVQATFLGLTTFVCFLLFAFGMLYISKKHLRIFRERYNLIPEQDRPIRQHVISAGHRRRVGFLEV